MSKLKKKALRLSNIFSPSNVHLLFMELHFYNKNKYVLCNLLNILYFIIICLDSKNKELEVQPSTKEVPEILQSNEQINKDISNALVT